ncbi:CobW family GTP-binding protein [Aureispira anguillae]|uniref:GTP-binding protein n=1 Tax=Aureispira anguillae TaxID=2864201 RepID=A0A915YLE8_9BACT|nr:GTP-binding protein [Aureispira anguillae]BDS15374.1 GTP-binding protein [Aureispira anguillae]
MKDNRVPVTILTGFLGAGKTTLLNHLITTNPKIKFAIIENEFGDIGIDNELVVGADSGIFEMSNGCICCTLNGELVQTLVDLVNGEHEFEHLIVETTGIAEPDAVAAAFVAEPAIQSRFRLDATICLVDAHHAEDILEEREEAKRQITFADYIVINKASEVSTEYLAKLEQILRAANSFAAIEHCDYGKVTSDILNLNAYDVHQVEKKLDHAHTHHEHHHDHEHQCDDSCSHGHEKHHEHHHHHHHHSDIVTHSFIIKAPLDVLKFRHWLNVLLMIQGKHLYRVKGIMNFQYQDKKAIVQSVKQMCVFTAGDDWSESDERLTKIVFIGKHLRKDILEKQLKNCLA